MIRTSATIVLMACLAGSCGETDLPAKAVGRIAGAATLTPGSYGPVFQEAGFDGRGGYFDQGFQTTVNHYGGNLIVSATDVSIPGQGRFGLSFTRTWNSHRTLNLTDQVLARGDSPLGLGWTFHYGLLRRTAPGQDANRPEFVDSTGARHVFYLHNQLNGAGSLPIGAAGSAWISDRLEILTRTDADHFVMRTPEGLVYDLTRLPQYDYLVPTRITDVHGNAWQIAYDPAPAPYFEHPLPATVTDDLGRILRFTYFTPVAATGKRRLQFLRLGAANATPLAEYQYVHANNNAFAFLRRHFSGERRLTEYVTDTDPLPEFGTITRIIAPTGGETVIGYQLKSFFFKPGDPRPSFAVTSITRGGHTWTYEYPGPAQPQRPEFTVTVKADGVIAGTYTYFTYATADPCDANTWKVGTLTASSESWNGTTRTRALSYDGLVYSQAGFLDSCGQQPRIPRLLTEVVTRDGFALTTTYSDFVLTSPRRIDRPGGVRQDLSYHNVASPARYLLGSPLSDETLANNVQIGRTVWHYPGPGDVLPDYLRLYRSATSYVQADLTHYTAGPGKLGALRSKVYGQVREIYDYQNGVPSSVDHADGPDLVRTVNPDGTIASETRDGVTRTFTWDRDARLTGIDHPAPDADLAVTYTTSQAIMTHGDAELRLTYDGFGRLTERREKVQGSPATYLVTSYGAFDAHDRPATETTPAGAVYALAYDVEGRPTQRSAAGDDRRFAYTTTAVGTETTETLNGSLVRKSLTDLLGREAGGATGGHAVTMSYAADATAPAGMKQAIQPAGQSPHWFKRDHLGTRIAEHHPETGELTYPITAEGWVGGVTGPTGDYRYVLDPRGRLTGVRAGAAASFLTRGYDPVYGGQSLAKYRETRVEWLDRDAVGRAQRLRLTLPRALQAPLPTYPFEWWVQGGIPTPGSAGYNPWFEWEAITGAGAADVTGYDLELRQAPRDRSVAECELGAVRHRARVPAPARRLAFAALPSALVNGTPYCFRVRGVKASGEVGPFSHWVMFKLGGGPKWPSLAKAIATRPGIEMIACSAQARALSRIMVDCPDDESPPVTTDAVTPPEIVAPATAEIVFDVELRYDGLGRLARVRHPDRDTSWSKLTAKGSWQEYTFNAMAGHDKVAYRREADPGPISLVSGTSYDRTGGPADLSVPLLDYDLLDSGRVVTVRRTRDSLGRLRSLRISEGETAHHNAYDLEYDGWGLLKSLQRSDGALTGAMGYTYDGLGRLATFSVNGQTVTYSYDARGNLTGHTGLSITGLRLAPGYTAQASLTLPSLSGATYDASNRLAGWSHDAGGRVTGDGTFTYVYNELDQVAEVRQGTWVVAQYLYDADGHRVREVADSRVVYSVRGAAGELISQETHYPWGKDQRLSEKRDFIYHNGLPTAEIVYWAGGPAYPEYTFRDRLGSPVVGLSGRHGFVPKYYEYAPYGQQMRSSPWRRDMTQEFTGHERDEVTGLDYMQLRYHQPRYGRFLRPDPLVDVDPRDPNSYNLYAYVRGNPVNFTDPTGGSVSRWRGPRLKGGFKVGGGLSLGPLRLKGRTDGSGGKGLDLSIGGLTLGINFADATPEDFWDRKMSSVDVLGLEKVTLKVEVGLDRSLGDSSYGPDGLIALFAKFKAKLAGGVEMSFIEGESLHSRFTSYVKAALGAEIKGSAKDAAGLGFDGDVKLELFSLEKVNSFDPMYPGRLLP